MNGKSSLNKSLIILGIISIILIIFLASYKILTEKRISPAEERETGVQKKVEIPVVDDTMKRPEKEEKQQLGFGQVVNYPGIKMGVKIDVLSEYRKNIYDLIDNTLKEIGYSLVLYNRDKLTSEFDTTGVSESHYYQSSCGRYKFVIDQDKKQIDIFYLIENPELDCSTLPVMKPVLDSISEIKGSRDWWTDGATQISVEQGRDVLAEDLPIRVVVIEE